MTSRSPVLYPVLLSIDVRAYVSGDFFGGKNCISSLRALAKLHSSPKALKWSHMTSDPCNLTFNGSIRVDYSDRS